MGTPEFSVPVLQSIAVAGHEIVAVITAPDKPSGRGLTLSESAVKKAAVEMGLPVLQPDKLKGEEFIATLKNLNPDVAVVVAFRMLPEAVWRIPTKGTLNLHASLLPDYRGAAPINWAIINGETETGMSTFLIDKEIDTGALLMQEKFAIPAEWDAGKLHDFMMTRGGDLVVKTLEAIENNSVKPVPQFADAKHHSAPKIFKDTCRIDWTWNVVHIHNLVRGLSPYPTAFTALDGKLMKVFKGKSLKGAAPALPGTVFSNEKNYLAIACEDGLYELMEIQLEGKKRMTTEEFLRGYKLKNFTKVVHDQF